MPTGVLTFLWASLNENLFYYIRRTNCTCLKKQLLIPLLLVFAFARGQSLRTPVGFLYTGLTAYSRQFPDAFSFSANQASLAAAKEFSAGVYSEQRFLLKALRVHAAAFVLPTASGNFGLRGQYAGEAAYNETSLGFAYAKNLGRKMAVGVQFNYVGLKTAGYGAASTFNFDAGAIVHLSSQLNAGLHVHNPVAKRFGKEGTEKLPFMYSAGLGYDVSPQVFIGVEAEKVEGQALGINGGVHYKLAEKLVARAGLRSATATYCFGFGVQLRWVRLDATAAFHPYLGVSPGLLLLYSSKE